MSAIDNAIDELIINTNQYNISMIIHQLLHEKYYFNKEWYFRENDKPDLKANALRNDIKSNIADRFLERAKHWEKLEENNDNQEAMLQFKYRSIRLMHIADKLKNNERFIKEIITELKSFFSIN